MLPRFFHRILQGRGRNTGDEIREEFWETDFSNPGKTRFDIKSENSYDAYLLKGGGGKTRNSALVLGLKKSACLAWAEGSERYGDMALKARLRLDCKGGYGAAGIMFRLIDEGTYYMVLLSSRGHFRLDVVRNNTPLALIGWTEWDAPSSTGVMELTIIARAARLILLIDGRWVGEIDDASIVQGRLGFVLASYEAGQAGESHVAEAFLEYLSVDTRTARVEAAAWDISSGKNPVPRENRLRLAGTFAKMGQSAPALVQLQKLWETSGQEQEDLLLAVRLAQVLERYDEAEEYLGAALALSGGDPANSGVLAEEKAKILYARGRRAELRDYIAEILKTHKPSVVLLSLLGHALWECGNYREAGPVYDGAFELDSKNGLLAANAANVYDLLGEKEKALDRYLAAGRTYLEMDNYEDLGTLIPKILALGRDCWEAHALAGKWAFGVEDWESAGKEFKLAETLQKKAGTPAKDPALCFLKGLLLIREGKRRKALPLLEEAARLAPDYGLFYFRLAETRYLLDNKPADPRLRSDLEKALSLLDEAGETWGWANNLAAQLSLAEGDTEAAAKYLEKAAATLGERPPVLVNRAVYQYLCGSLDRALAILDKGLDTEGLMANCAGNLLVRAGQFEQAHDWYERALTIAPDNQEFLINCASCLIEMGRYGEADTFLARAHSRAPSPAVLELITYVAVKKGEYYRAESACNAALELDSAHIPSLRSLGWLFCTTRRWDEAGTILTRLEALPLSGEDAEHREELRRRILDGTTQLIPCAVCGRTWRVPLDPPPVSFLRLVAMPPDEIPAGTCPSCGTSYCIGCAREHVDKGGRFTCPVCGKPLKLINEGLKKIVADWAAGALPESAP
ncbi:MAG: tetratricopeptide repeat protein [Treponema sp.]|nr:tetratricopeptide repeat protein [Treponema sp.]